MKSELTSAASDEDSAAEVLELAEAMLHVDPSWRVVRVNRSHEELFHVAREDVQGRRLWDAWAPAGDAPIERELRRCMTDRLPVQLDALSESVGSWIRVRASPVRSGGIAVFLSDVSEAKRTEEALHSCEARHRASFEQSALGMGTVRLADCRWVDVNDAFCQLVGRLREDVLALAWPDITHPEDLDLDGGSLRQLKAGELGSYTVEKRLVHAQGHAVWTKLTFSLVREPGSGFEHATAIVEDIRDRKRAEKELEGSRALLEAERARLQTILDTIPTGLIALDDSGSFVIENAEWKRTWAGSGVVSAVADQRYIAFRPDTGAPISDDEWPCMMSLRQGIQTRDVILDIERFDGTCGTIVVSSAPLRDETGAVTGAVAANMDITELRATQSRLQDADRRKDDFLVALSHELRNPLAPIRAALYLLDHVEAGGPQAQRARMVITRQVKHLSKLVDDLLDVTRIARGKFELRRSDLNLVSLVQRTCEDYSAFMRERGMDLRLSVPSDAIWVNGDPTRLTQMLGNLLSNAAKFTPSGGEVTVEAKTVEGFAVLSVCDTGVGIPEELLPKIFDPFMQATQTIARSEGGLGLGLAFVKGVAELHGGRVRVKSSTGTGTEVSVEIPRSPAAHGESGSVASHVDGRGRRVCRVLVVDDNVDAAEMLAEVVRSFGQDVEVVHDGFSAVARFEARHHHVVLCDIGLPGMSGFDVARALRPKLDGTTTLVALSGYASPEDVQKAIAAGFDAHIAKPAEPHVIERLFIPAALQTRGG